MHGARAGGEVAAQIAPISMSALALFTEALMTRIAILADIHGNLPALTAVLADLDHVAPDQVIVNGDVINRGPQSRECLDVVRSMGWPVVYGNHEDYALKYDVGIDDDPDSYSDFWLPIRLVAEQELSADDLEYLRTLPRAYVLDLPGLPAVRLVHGSMRGLSDGMGFWMSDEELINAVRDAPEPVVIGAHTHRPLDRHVGTRWVLNSGAVGMPYNGDPHAQYLQLEGRGGAWSAEFRQVPYDRAEVYAAWDRCEYITTAMSAQIFKYELETATFHLGIYLKFCKRHGLERNTMASVERYRYATRDVKPGRSASLSQAS